MGKEHLTEDRHPAGKGVSVGDGHLSCSASHSQAHTDPAGCGCSGGPSLASSSSHPSQEEGSYTV